MIFEMGDEIKYYKPMIIELNKIFHIQKQIYHSDTITTGNPAIQALEGLVKNHARSYEKYLLRKFLMISVPHIIWPILDQNQRPCLNFDLEKNHKTHKIKMNNLSLSLCILPRMTTSSVSEGSS